MMLEGSPLMLRAVPYIAGGTTSYADFPLVNAPTLNEYDISQFLGHSIPGVTRIMREAHLRLFKVLYKHLNCHGVM